MSSIKISEFVFVQIHLISLSVLRPYLPLNAWMVLKLDTAPFVIVSSRSARFRQKPVKELLKMLWKSVSKKKILAPSYLSKGTAWVKNFRNNIFHSNSSNCWISANSVVRLSISNSWICGTSSSCSLDLFGPKTTYIANNPVMFQRNRVKISS